MKRLLKAIVVSILGWQVRRLQKQNSFKTIGVVGAYGKTSTKLAIAEMLETEFHVRYQKGNYNDTSTVPLVFFGHNLPSLFNPFAWLMIFIKNEAQLRHIFPYDVVVIELGIDGPNQMQKFKKFLKLDYALVTSLGPEHMEYFSSVEEAAAEELRVQQFTRHMILNKDLCPSNLLKSLKSSHEFYELDHANKLPIDSWRIKLGDLQPVRIHHRVLSKARLYSLSSAIVIGRKLKLSMDRINKTLPKISYVPGRMSTLKGKKGSLIIDDSYNASPEATILALNTIYSYPAKQRIALLGNMNELGEFAAKMHRQVGEACDSGKLDLLITLGPDSNQYLADQAEKNGCQVIRSKTPYEAANIIEDRIKNNSVILVKGSQNGVFAEEAVKLLLQDPHDSKRLVRQTRSWLAKKRKSFELL